MKKKTDRQGIFLLRFEIYNGSLMKHLLLGRGGGEVKSLSHGKHPIHFNQQEIFLEQSNKSVKDFTSP